MDRHLPLYECPLFMTQKVEVILGFDYGLSQIGVATAQTVTNTASALRILSAKSGIPDWNELAALMTEWQPTRLVVGLPLNMDGSESEMSGRARKFANRLHGRFGLPVELMDERLSSFSIKQSIREAGDNKKSKKTPINKVDAEVAALILQGWLDGAAAIKKTKDSF